MTGFGISLLTGSGNYSVALVIRDESFWEKYRHEMRTNWEASEKLSPVLSTRDPGLGQKLKDRDWADYAFHSIIEGLMFLKERAPERVKLPDISREPGKAP
jgi:hypothetical protein